MCIWSVFSQRVPSWRVLNGRFQFFSAKFPLDKAMLLHAASMSYVQLAAVEKRSLNPCVKSRCAPDDQLDRLLTQGEVQSRLAVLLSVTHLRLYVWLTLRSSVPGWSHDSSLVVAPTAPTLHIRICSSRGRSGVPRECGQRLGQTSGSISLHLNTHSKRMIRRSFPLHHNSLQPHFYCRYPH